MDRYTVFTSVELSRSFLDRDFPSHFIRIETSTAESPVLYILSILTVVFNPFPQLISFV